MRRAFVEALTEVAGRDERVVFLTGDLGFQVFDDFRKRFGPRYVNVGVAEAALVNCAAGLALEGFRPVAYSIASFMTGRPFEQIRFSVAYPRLPVVIVGAGGGYCYSGSGVSHHAPDDLALMSLLPGMTVVAPGDPGEVRALLPQLLALEGPSYMRIGKFGEPACEADSPVVLGKARVLRPGGTVAVVTTGETAPIAMEAAGRLAAEGVNPALFQFHTLKPLDTDAVSLLAGTFATVIVAEECSPAGGLASSIAACHSGLVTRPAIVRLGPPDQFVLGSPRRDALRRHFAFGPEAIEKACREAWRASRRRPGS
jgi:transketolase